MTYQQKIYRERRRKGLCVACGLPVSDGKSRCPFCMKKLYIACQESKNRKIKRLEDQIIALGGTVEMKSKGGVNRDQARTPESV